MNKIKTWLIIIFGALTGVAISQALKASGWITESNRVLVFVIILGTIGLFVFISSAVKAYKGEENKELDGNEMHGEKENPSQQPKMSTDAHSEKSDNVGRRDQYFYNKGVDPERVPIFEKIARIIGLTIVVLFAMWFWSEDLFEDLGKEIGGRRNKDIIGIGLFGLFLVVGWFRRFQIGVIVFSCVFFIGGTLKKIFKAI